MKSVINVFGSSPTKAVLIPTPPLSPSSSPRSNPVNMEKKSHPVDMTPSQRTQALQEVKDILSTSPQFSTSPRRKSSPEALQRRLNLKDLPPLVTPLTRLCILRKKSGEVVRPSLKQGASKSEPTTPTCPKFVHFDTDLEHVRFFLEAEKPLAVSCDVSSEEEDSDEETSSESDDDDDYEGELVITLPNFPRITTLHSSKPVLVESIFLSKDQRKLQGRIQVQNIAFQKTVIVRYTFDFWSSVSEVTASYSEDAQDRKNNTFDVFEFNIGLIDNSRNPINGQTMFFAVCYMVDNRELWDNNNASNYQVNFKRLTKQTSPSSRSKSIKSFSKWPSNQNSTKISKQRSDEICRSPLSPASSALTLVPGSTQQKMISSRYDIKDSLSAAMIKPTSLVPSSSSSSTTTPSPRPHPIALNPPQTHVNHHIRPYSLANNTEGFNAFFGEYIDGMPSTVDPTASWINDSPKQFKTKSNFEVTRRSTPIAIPSSTKPAIGSSSYYELVDRYCFYQGSPCSTNYASSPPVMT
ncbi:hypothetical protein G9A89_004370 [Geosiphon pyriformis]|nr:hypothetical protein G9A89_004370 [Geosiphon pyriformis]